MMGFMQLRRQSTTASDELRTELVQAEQALEFHWRGLMKTAAEVLNKQQSGADVDTASSSAAKLVPRETQSEPLRGLNTKYSCNKRGRVGSSSSMPRGGICNQSVKEYFEHGPAHSVGASSSPNHDNIAAQVVDCASEAE